MPSGILVGNPQLFVTVVIIAQKQKPFTLAKPAIAPGFRIGIILFSPAGWQPVWKPCFLVEEPEGIDNIEGNDNSPDNRYKEKGTVSKHNKGNKYIRSGQGLNEQVVVRSLQM